MAEHRIPVKSAIGFDIAEGASFTVVNPEGAQIADLVAFSADDASERFSTGYTRALTRTLRPTTGDTLYTNEGNAILEISHDDCGVHDILFCPCDEFLLNEFHQPEPGGCRENLILALQQTTVRSADVGEPFNVFMRTEVTDGYELELAASPAQPGDRVRFEAEMDCHIAVSSCSALENTSANGDRLTPIDLELPAGTVVHHGSVQTPE